MRAALALVALSAAVAASVAGASNAAAGTALRIAYWADGSSALPDKIWTLRCNPPRGAVSKPGVACGKLAAGGVKLFAPLPPDTACTQIYGGPQKALVSGTAGGRRVWAILLRNDGCQIDRWNRFVPWLLPRGGAST